MEGQQPPSRPPWGWLTEALRFARAAAFRVLKNRSDADDVAQSAGIEFCALDEPPTPELAWTIARRIALRVVRNRQAEEEAKAKYEATRPARESKDAIWAKVGKLLEILEHPPEALQTHHWIMIQCIMEDVSEREMSRRLKVSRKKVKQIRSETIQMLEDHWTEQQR